MVVVSPVRRQAAERLSGGLGGSGVGSGVIRTSSLRGRRVTIILDSSKRDEVLLGFPILRSCPVRGRRACPLVESGVLRGRVV